MMSLKIGAMMSGTRTLLIRGLGSNGHDDTDVCKMVWISDVSVFRKNTTFLPNCKYDRK